MKNLLNKDFPEFLKLNFKEGEDQEIKREDGKQVPIQKRVSTTRSGHQDYINLSLVARSTIPFSTSI